MKKFTALVLALALILSLGVTVSASSSDNEAIIQEAISFLIEGDSEGSVKLWVVRQAVDLDYSAEEREALLAEYEAAKDAAADEIAAARAEREAAEKAEKEKREAEEKAAALQASKDALPTLVQDGSTITLTSDSGLAAVLQDVISYEEIIVDNTYYRVFHLAEDADDIYLKNISYDSDYIDIDMIGGLNAWPVGGIGGEWVYGEMGGSQEPYCPPGHTLTYTPEAVFEANGRLLIHDYEVADATILVGYHIDWGREDIELWFTADNGRISFTDYTVDGISFDDYIKQSAAPAIVGSFGDVAADAYYAEPVKWAVEKGITDGTSDSTFSPEQTCSNAHILTFLWRAYNKPEAAAAGLTDVAADDYFYGAANWAKSLGMISGAEMSPDAPCTRASTVMFMWKAAGSPSVSTQTKFTDVAADADYAMAVAWAVENGVTDGTSDTTFSPNDTCTRGQIVTFLYRALA